MFSTKNIKLPLWVVYGPFYIYIYPIFRHAQIRDATWVQSYLEILSALAVNASFHLGSSAFTEAVLKMAKTHLPGVGFDQVTNIFMDLGFKWFKQQKLGFEHVR